MQRLLECEKGPSERANLVERRKVRDQQLHAIIAAPLADLGRRRFATALIAANQKEFCAHLRELAGSHPADSAAGRADPVVAMDLAGARHLRRDHGAARGPVRTRPRVRALR